MGLFQNKKPQKQSPDEQATAAVDAFFDDEFREYLRERGRTYFERIINENAILFKQDLDATVAHINTELRQQAARQLDQQFEQINKVNHELRQHVAKQLDEQFATFTETTKHAQDMALQSLERSAQGLEEQHKQLGVALERSVAKQDALLSGAVEDTKEQIDAMKATQEQAMEALSRNTQTLEEQYKRLSDMLEEGIERQKAIVIEAFEQNMARIVEHYLLNAVSDQFDLRSQLPAIMQQLEQNKQAIADDMKL